MARFQVRRFRHRWKGRLARLNPSSRACREMSVVLRANPFPPVKFSPCHPRYDWSISADNMAVCQNVLFSGKAPEDDEFDHPAGASLARYLETKLSQSGWQTSHFDNWRDCGWSILCSRNSSKLMIAFGKVRGENWLLQISPESIPSFLSRFFGRSASATEEDVLLLAKDTDGILHTMEALGDFKWRWDGFPSDQTS